MYHCLSWFLLHYANYQKLYSLQEFKWIISGNMCQESGNGLAGSSAQGLTRLKSAAGGGCDGHLSPLLISLVVGTVHSLVAVGLTCSFYCWLLTRSCSRLLEVCIFLPCGPMLTAWQSTFFQASSLLSLKLHPLLKAPHAYCPLEIFKRGVLPLSDWTELNLNWRPLKVVAGPTA